MSTLIEIRIFVERPHSQQLFHNDCRSGVVYFYCTSLVDVHFRFFLYVWYVIIFFCGYCCFAMNFRASARGWCCWYIVYSSHISHLLLLFRNCIINFSSFVICAYQMIIHIHTYTDTCTIPHSFTRCSIGHGTIKYYLDLTRFVCLRFSSCFVLLFLLHTLTRAHTLTHSHTCTI